MTKPIRVKPEIQQVLKLISAEENVTIQALVQEILMKDGRVLSKLKRKTTK